MPTPQHPTQPAATLNATGCAHPPQTEAHDGGLLPDLQRLVELAVPASARRQALRWLAGGGLGLSGGLSAWALVGCGGSEDGDSSNGSGSSGSDASSGGSSGSGGSTATPSSCSVIPEETAGPYPGDGSNNSNGSVANALSLSGIMRSDIRSSVGNASGTAEGIQLTVKLQLVNTGSSCAALDGYAIYLWHCDAVGRYSMYSSGVTHQNYLRGVQPTDSSGVASFTTIFPGCYSGRMPHIHFEVYRSANTATSFSNKLKTSQLAFPVAACQTVYADSRYTGSTGNLAAISFSSDNVFSDGVSTQLATLTGNNTDGYVATLVVGISA